MVFDIFDFYRHCSSYFTVNGNKMREDIEPEPKLEQDYRSSYSEYKQEPRRTSSVRSKDGVTVGDLWKERNMKPQDPFSKNDGDTIEILEISGDYVLYVYKTLYGKPVTSKLDPHSMELSWIKRRYILVKNGNDGGQRTTETTERTTTSRGWDTNDVDIEVGDTLIERSDPSITIEIVDIEGDILSYVFSKINGRPHTLGRVTTNNKETILKLYKK